jgi:hypothetical protein
LPAPTSWIPEIESPPDQLHVPAGTFTLSPGLAELIADCTADNEHDVALTVAASTNRTPTIAATATININVCMDVFER